MVGKLSLLFPSHDPAGGGSKRIKNKNVCLVGGKPLITYCIEQALEVTKNVFVSTDCEKIKRVCQPYNVTIIDRPKHLATDVSDVRDTIRHFFEKNNNNVLVLMQPTSPLVKSKFVFEGIKKMNKFDSIISVCEMRSFFWSENGKPLNYDPLNKPRTQDMDALYMENGAFYITRRDNFISQNTLTNGRVGFVVMPQELSIDIDTETDLKNFRDMIKYMSEK
jgi:N-acylneuraminate cytidylyltransferase